MYGKALIPGTNGVNVPLVVVASPPGPIIEQLRAQGWTPYGSGLGEGARGTLTITPYSLTLDTADGRVMEDDDNPLAPAGWWEAVDAIGGRAVAVVLPPVDIRAADFADRFVELIDDPSTAHALVHVVT